MNNCFYRTIYLLFLAGLLTACQSEEQSDTTDGVLNLGQQGETVVDTDAPSISEPDCADLDSSIGISTQVEANALAYRGNYPLILAHGLFGMNKDYAGADIFLRQQGFAVYKTTVSLVDSSEDKRGLELARQIACIALAAGVTQVNVIAHSQGGLDARIAAQSEYASYIASITTISTPHRGSLIADIALGLLPGVASSIVDTLVDSLSLLIGIDKSDSDFHTALTQLSEAHQENFNSHYPDNPAISYFSWAGRSVRSPLSFDRADQECADGVFANPDARDIIDAVFYIPWEILNMYSGKSDGVVTLASAKWGTFMGCIAADHGDQVGGLNLFDTNPVSGFNHKSFYLQVATDLELRGY